MSTTRQNILRSALACFEWAGYQGTTTAAICKAAGVSNGSFFHHFGSKDGVAASLFLEALRSYHGGLLAGMDRRKSASAGIRHLLTSHIAWVLEHQAEAHFLFEQSRAEWLGPIDNERQRENDHLAEQLENWRRPLIEAGALPDMPPMVFFSQVIGPAQMLTRQWLSANSEGDLRQHSKLLGECAVRALTP